MSASNEPAAEILAEIYRLADAFCDQVLTHEEAARLNELLRAHPELKNRFLEHTAVHARLMWQGSKTPPLTRAAAESPAATVERGLSWRFLYLAGLGLCLCLLVAVYLFRREPAPFAPSVATLKNASDASWQGEPTPQLGETLKSGSSLRLTAGVAILEFASGATAVLQGPAELELLGVSEAFLHHGNLVIHVSGTNNSFRVETPTARVLDLGTEFGVNVAGSGTTIVQVYQGAVLAETRETQAGPAERIEAGQAQRIDKQGSTDYPFNPDGFVRYLPGPDDPRGRSVYPYNKSKYDAIHVVPAPPGVVIDGDLSDWDLSGRFVSACMPPYAANYYLEGSMMYDAKNLYLGAHVGDPFPMRSMISPHVKRREYGNGGCVAFRVSTDRKLGWPLKGESRAAAQGPADAWDFNPKLVFLVLWYYRPEQKACMLIRHGMEYKEVDINPPGYRGAFRMDPDGKGYTAEYAIPWSLLDAADDPPRGGDVLGTTWLAHWSDATGQNWQGQLIDGTNQAVKGWNFERAATWGKAIYHPTGNLPPGTVRLREE